MKNQLKELAGDLGDRLIKNNLETVDVETAVKLIKISFMTGAGVMFNSLRSCATTEMTVELLKRCQFELEVYFSNIDTILKEFNE